MSGKSGFLGAYTRLPKVTRLSIGCVGILFSVLGIVATPGLCSSCILHSIRKQTTMHILCEKLLPLRAIRYVRADLCVNMLLHTYGHDSVHTVRVFLFISTADRHNTYRA